MTTCLQIFLTFFIFVISLLFVCELAALSLQVVIQVQGPKVNGAHEFVMSAGPSGLQ